MLLFCVRTGLDGLKWLTACLLYYDLTYSELGYVLTKSDLKPYFLQLMNGSNVISN